MNIPKALPSDNKLRSKDEFPRPNEEYGSVHANSHENLINHSRRMSTQHKNSNITSRYAGGADDSDEDDDQNIPDVPIFSNGMH